MTKRANAISALCAVFLVLALASCKGRRDGGYRPLAISGEKIELAEAYAMLSDTYRPWADLYCPVAISIESPERASVSGRCAMVRDSLIYFSLRALGSEVATVRITPDSLCIIDRYNGAFLAEPLDSILSSVPISLSDMQDLLLGHAFAPDSAAAARCIATMDRGKAMLRSISFTSDAGHLTAFLYADTVGAPAGPVASSIAASIGTRTAGFSATMQWKLKDAKWNTGRRQRFREPKPAYRRIRPSDIAL